MMGGRDWRKTALAWVASTAALREDSLLLCEWRGRGPKRPCKSIGAGCISCLVFLGSILGSTDLLHPTRIFGLRHHVSLAWGSFLLGVIALGISSHLRR